ncbi:MAG: sigma-70 family RNA polymerase sigma factor [Xanthomonadales bacterium]|nr:sigma-70 family RNA polymerase sigma factor [Xanthomonadales bacterium]
MSASEAAVTDWIRAWQDGDVASRDRVFTQLYPELRRIARGVLRQHSGHDTLQPTALLNDALLKLAGAAPADTSDRVHFANVVARAMRQVLVDRARRKQADKRGAGLVPEPLDGQDIAEGATPEQILAVDEALARLADLDPRAASVLELRVFGGLTIDETATAMGIHPSAVNREWAFASAWLKQQLGGDV